ncbi:MAG: ATP-binding cassette domain-containing protein [Candidatus Aminicenantes bacterium]|nr:ATP-binding cassette domain-containing protein [Candidatus Aminicenantes bacterium]
MDNEVLVRVENISKKFCRNLKKSLWYGLKDIGREIFNRANGDVRLRPEEFWALKDVSFELKRGECLGLIGPNGAGKSTLLKLLNGLIKPDQGRICIRGRIGALIELGAGFNPILSGRENIYINAAVLGIKKRDIENRLEEIIEFSELREFIDMPVQSYSSGMKVRIGFAIATAMNPDILLLDEILAVGDIRFRTKCYQRIGEIIKNAAVVYVAHDMNQISRICNRLLLLHKGDTVHYGEVKEGIQKYHHLYHREKMNSKTPPQGGLKVFDKNLSIHSVNLIPSSIKSGQKVKVQIDYSAKKNIEIGSLHCNFKTSSQLLAAAYISNMSGDEYGFKKGSHQITIQLGKLNLTTDKYIFSCAAFDETQKIFLFSAFDYANFDVIGNFFTTGIIEMGDKPNLENE